MMQRSSGNWRKMSNPGMDHRFYNLSGFGYGVPATNNAPASIFSRNGGAFPQNQLFGEYQPMVYPRTGMNPSMGMVSNIPNGPVYNPFAAGPSTPSNVNAPVADDFSLRDLSSDLDEILKEVERKRSGSVSSSGNSDNTPQQDKWNEKRTPEYRTLFGRGKNYYKHHTTALPYPPGLPITYGTDEIVPSHANNRSMKKRKEEKRMECAFCKGMRNPGDYTTHWMKNNRGIIICPVLRAYNCPHCNNGGGNYAHTQRYCPTKRKIQALQYQQARDASLRLA